MNNKLIQGYAKCIRGKWDAIISSNLLPTVIISIEWVINQKSNILNLIMFKSAEINKFTEINKSGEKLSVTFIGFSYI